MDYRQGWLDIRTHSLPDFVENYSHLFSNRVMLIFGDRDAKSIYKGLVVGNSFTNQILKDKQEQSCCDGYESRILPAMDEDIIRDYEGKCVPTGNLEEVRMGKTCSLPYSGGENRTVVFLNLSHWNNLDLNFYNSVVHFILRGMRTTKPTVQIDRVVFIGAPSRFQNRAQETMALADFFVRFCKCLDKDTDSTADCMYFAFGPTPFCFCFSDIGCFTQCQEACLLYTSVMAQKCSGLCFSPRMTALNISKVMEKWWKDNQSVSYTLSQIETINIDNDHLCLLIIRQMIVILNHMLQRKRK